ncbi:isoprenoid synthase domain-containing protein [Mycena olivaceomarginata]|nr:isoprenoid synthase domain-containing protein [Mycena olivaceomarginata]
MHCLYDYCWTTPWHLKAIIRSLLDAVAYDTSSAPFFKSSADALGKAIDAEVASWNADDGKNGAKFASSTKKAVVCVEFFYSRHTFEVKLAFGLYAWFFFYIDDCAEKLSLQDYQRRLLLGQLKDTSALAHFHKFCANAMVCAAFEFMSGTILETREEVSTMQISSTATSWPKYFRAKTGMAPGFSYAIFPKDTHPNIATYIQVLPDIDDYMCLVNDILSFYKEELAGETNNYVQVRSKATLKHPNQVLVEMVQEVGDLHARITATLEQQPEALVAWKTLEYGFIAFHLSLGRYKLSQLGLGRTE